MALDLLDKEVQRKSEETNQKIVEKYVDRVQLGVDGWKMRYYTNKFLVYDPNDVQQFTDKIK